MGSSDDMQAGIREGRIEICINNAWGRVCDTLFGREDAAVVCEQLEGFQRNGEYCYGSYTCLCTKHTDACLQAWKCRKFW